MTPRHRKSVPTLWLMTDERVDDAALVAAVARLPRGKAGVVFRHYRTQAHARRVLFEQVLAIARRRRLVLMLAGSARTAAAWKADGWHGRDARRVAGPMLHSAPAHDRREVIAAGRDGAAFLFLSPIFATRSHPGARPLGRLRFALLARQAQVPVLALGGVKRDHGKALRAIGAAGWAAIDGLTLSQRPDQVP